jgi:hypothetical protein
MADMKQVLLNEQDEIEELIDRIGYELVLDLLSAICYLKAQHLRENWGDDPSARVWIDRARGMDVLAAKET